MEEDVFKARDSQIARLYGNSFINLCNLFELDTTDLESANEAVCALFEEVIAFKGKFKSEKLFPLQREYEKLVEFENEIDQCDNATKRESMITKCTLSKGKMRCAKLAIFLKKIIKASSAPNFGSITRLFAMQLKEFTSPAVAQI